PIPAAGAQRHPAVDLFISRRRSVEERSQEGRSLSLLVIGGEPGMGRDRFGVARIGPGSCLHLSAASGQRTGFTDPAAMISSGPSRGDFGRWTREVKHHASRARPSWLVLLTCPPRRAATF